MNLPEYMRDISDDLLRRSEQIARDLEHAPSAGASRENVVERILEDFFSLRGGARVHLFERRRSVEPN